MFRVGRDSCGSSSPTPLPKQGHLQQAAQDLVQEGLEYVQRRRLHNLLGQPVPVLRHPQSEEVLPHIQMELPLLQFVPISPVKWVVFIAWTGMSPSRGSGKVLPGCTCSSPLPCCSVPRPAAEAAVLRCQPWTGWGESSKQLENRSTCINILWSPGLLLLYVVALHHRRYISNGSAVKRRLFCAIQYIPVVIF